MLICLKLSQTANIITNNDVGVLLKSGSGLDSKSEKSKPSLTWLTDKIWLNILALSRHNFAHESGLTFFKELPDSITRNEAAWQTWYNKNDPENFPIPDFAERINAEKEMGSFIAICLIRAVREDRTLIASKQYIESILGARFTKPLAITYADIFEEMSTKDPVLFLLSPGADPTGGIDDLAKKKKKLTFKVSMGEG